MAKPFFLFFSQQVEVIPERKTNHDIIGVWIFPAARERLVFWLCARRAFEPHDSGIQFGGESEAAHPRAHVEERRNLRV